MRRLAEEIRVAVEEAEALAAEIRRGAVGKK